MSLIFYICLWLFSQTGTTALSVSYDEDLKQYHLTIDGENISDGYDYIQLRDDPLIAVGKDFYFGAINRKGKLIIPLKYNLVTTHSYGAYAYKGLATTVSYDNKGSKRFTTDLMYQCQPLNEDLSICLSATSRYVLNEKGESIQRCTDRNFHKIKGSPSWTMIENNYSNGLLNDSGTYLTLNGEKTYEIQSTSITFLVDDFYTLFPEASKNSWPDIYQNRYTDLISIVKKDFLPELRFIGITDHKYSIYYDLSSRELIDVSQYQNVGIQAYGPVKTHGDFLISSTKDNKQHFIDGLIRTPIPADGILSCKTEDHIVVVDTYGEVGKGHIIPLDKSDIVTIDTIHTVWDKEGEIYNACKSIAHIEGSAFLIDDNGLSRKHGLDQVFLTLEPVINTPTSMVLRDTLNREYLYFIAVDSISSTGYDKIEYLHEIKMYKMKSGDSYGLMDLDGNIILPIVHSEINFLHNYPYDPSLIILSRTGNKCDLLSRSGRMIKSFSDCRSIEMTDLPYIIQVEDNGDWTKLNSSGRWYFKN